MSALCITNVAEKNVLQGLWETERRLILSPHFYTLVSAICLINVSSLIQQSKKLDWWCFIACNSFMSALLMRWDVTVLGGSFNWLVRAPVWRCQTWRHNDPLKRFRSSLAAYSKNCIVIGCDLSCIHCQLPTVGGDVAIMLFIHEVVSLQWDSFISSSTLCSIVLTISYKYIIENLTWLLLYQCEHCCV